MRILLTGGGTGGHLFPGLAILEELQNRHNTLLLFVGTRKGIESRIVPERSIPFQTVWISGLHRGRLWGNVLFPVKMIVSLIQSLSAIMKFKPDVVIGTGGYVTWPVIKAAQLLGRTTILQEQNEAPGLVMKQLAAKATQVHLSFESSKTYFSRQDNLFVSGNPTRANLTAGSRSEGIEWFGLNPDRKTLFVFGGSQGALGLNRAMIKALPALMDDQGMQILWGSGPRWYGMVSEAANAWKDRIHVHAFIERMDLAYGAADLLLCRSGATTVAEINRLGLPAVYMPFPGAAANHQEENARVLETLGGAKVILESEAEAVKMADILISLLHNEAERSEMGKMALIAAYPDAAKSIADAIDQAMTAKHSVKEAK